MKELYKTENDLVVYLQSNGHIAFYENGNYYYQGDYEITIKEIENNNHINFIINDEERLHINYLMIYHNKDRWINSVYEYYAYQNQNYVKVRKDNFEECELEVLLANNFENYTCYEYETNYKYIIIEKKEVL